MNQVSGWYTLVIFTASMQEYADPVIDWLDGGRGILGHRLFRDVCFPVLLPILTLTAISPAHNYRTDRIQKICQSLKRTFHECVLSTTLQSATGSMKVSYIYTRGWIGLTGLNSQWNPNWRLDSWSIRWSTTRSLASSWLPAVYYRCSSRARATVCRAILMTNNISGNFF